MHCLVQWREWHSPKSIVSGWSHIATEAPFSSATFHGFFLPCVFICLRVPQRLRGPFCAACAADSGAGIMVQGINPVGVGGLRPANAELAGRADSRARPFGRLVQRSRGMLRDGVVVRALRADLQEWFAFKNQAQRRRSQQRTGQSFLNDCQRAETGEQGMQVVDRLAGLRIEFHHGRY